MIMILDTAAAADGMAWSKVKGLYL